MELNPNNKAVQQARDEWHKVCALIMVKLNVTEVQITMGDVQKLAMGNVNICLDARKEKENGYFTIRLVDDKTAHELARQEGGRPQDC